MKIIDAHVHLVQCIAGTGAGGELRSCGQGRGMYADGSVCQLLPAAWNTDQATPERILQLMDDHNVERAVLLQGGASPRRPKSVTAVSFICGVRRSSSRCHPGRLRVPPAG